MKRLKRSIAKVALPVRNIVYYIDIGVLCFMFYIITAVRYGSCPRPY